MIAIVLKMHAMARKIMDIAVSTSLILASLKKILRKQRAVKLQVLSLLAILRDLRLTKKRSESTF